MKKDKGINIMEWISVKDYLPNIGDIVLIYTPEKISFKDGQKDVIVQPAYLSQELGQDMCLPFMPVYGEANAFLYVTHWMPLPEKPK